MQAIEFETYVKNGVIELPEQYKDFDNRKIKVIIPYDEFKHIEDMCGKKTGEYSDKDSHSPREKHMKTIKIFWNAISNYSQWPGTLMVITGILLILIAPIIVWLFREEFANLNPRSLLNMWYGAGGLVLLYLTAGLPLGAILVSAGGAYLFPASAHARSILLPLLGIQIIYFTFHAIRLMIDLEISFMLFAVMGFIFISLFLTLVGIWMLKRPSLKPQRQRVADLQLAAGLCFFSAAWQSCGLLGAPGFAMYPEIVLKLGNQSFIAGQALATQFFIILGFVFLLISMRTDRAKNQDNGEHLDMHDQAT